MSLNKVQKFFGSQNKYCNFNRLHLMAPIPALGTANEHSDVDLCFFFTDYDDRIAVGVKLFALKRKYDAYIEPHITLSSDFNDENPFGKEILRTGLEL
ncbi:MAG: nucleotidyltransferase domain-containing protein [Deltaproteobacteria bacterium]|nr:nucleotidyltransferase domain-containing protein [Deltaproteobacteria bacterium]